VKKRPFAKKCVSATHKKTGQMARF